MGSYYHVQCENEKPQTNRWPAKLPLEKDKGKNVLVASILLAIVF
jgi:hypothetical protein